MGSLYNRVLSALGLQEGSRHRELDLRLVWRGLVLAVEVGIHTYLTPVGTVSHLLTQPEEALGSPEVWECVRPQDRGNLLFIGCQPGGMVPAPFSTGSQCQRHAALTQSRPPVHTREV